MVAYGDFSPFSHALLVWFRKGKGLTGVVGEPPWPPFILRWNERMRAFRELLCLHSQRVERSVPLAIRRR